MRKPVPRANLKLNKIVEKGPDGGDSPKPEAIKDPSDKTDFDGNGGAATVVWNSGMIDVIV